MALSNTYKTKKGVKTPAELNQEMAIKKQQEQGKTNIVQPNDPTTYQIGETVFKNKADYDKAKALIEVRTPTGSQQLQKVTPEIKRTVEASNVFEAQQGRATEQQIAAINAQSEQEKQDIINNQLKFADTSSDLSVPSIERNTFSKVPVLGASGGVLANVATDFEAKREAKRRANSAIQREVFEKGVSANDKFGAVVESIPIVGALINKYAKGIISTPKGDVDNFVSQLNQVYTQAREEQKYAKLSPEFKDMALSNLDDANENIEELEAKIKLASIYSAELRANPEDLELIERKIANTRAKLLRIRINIISGADVSNDEELIDAAGDFLE